MIFFNAGRNICPCTGVLADMDSGAVDVTMPQENQTKCAVFSCCSSLNGLPGHLMMSAVQSFVCCLQEELKTTDVYLYRKVLDNLASCMEDFSLGTVTSNIFWLNLLSTDATLDSNVCSYVK